MKLFLALLTNHDIPRLTRLVRCVLEAYPTERLQIEPVIVVNSLNEKYYGEVLAQNFPFRTVKTKSNGLPGKGKNSCAELFLQSDCDFLCQYDGDDMFYPTFARSLENHIYQYPSMDVLGIIPADSVRTYKQNCGTEFEVGGYTASVWGISMVKPEGRQRYMGRGDWVDQKLPWNDNYIILQSKKSAIYKMREDLKVGEDALYNITLLKAHQERKISYFLTMSSDIKFVDATAENSIQKKYSSSSQIQLWKDEALKIINPNRSCFNELPIIHNELLISDVEKEVWVKNNF